MMCFYTVSMHSSLYHLPLYFPLPLSFCSTFQTFVIPEHSMTNSVCKATPSWGSMMQFPSVGIPPITNSSLDMPWALEWLQSALTDTDKTLLDMFGNTAGSIIKYLVRWPVITNSVVYIYIDKLLTFYISVYKTGEGRGRMHFANFWLIIRFSIGLHQFSHMRPVPTNWATSCKGTRRYCSLNIWKINRKLRISQGNNRFWTQIKQQLRHNRPF